MTKEEAYEVYISELLRWNKVHKLISRADETKILQRHIKDAEEVFDKIKDFDLKEIADVGAGAGFLGVVFSILDRDRKVYFVEVVAKKCAFLEYLKTKLGLNYQVMCKDANKPSLKFESTIERALGKPADIVDTMERLSNRYVFLVVGQNENLEPLKKLGYKDTKLSKGFLLLKDLK